MLKLILLFKNVGGAQAVKTVVGALLIAVGSQRTIAGAHLHQAIARLVCSGYSCRMINISWRE